MKKSATLRKISNYKTLSSSPSKRVIHSSAVFPLTPQEAKPEDLLSQKFKNQIQSCRTNKKPIILKPNRVSHPQTARASPKSNSTPILHRIAKSNPYESKQIRPKALKSLIKVKKMLPKDSKQSKPKTSVKEFVTQVNRDVYDLPEKLLTSKEVKQRHEAIHKAHLMQTFHGLKVIESMKKAETGDFSDKVVNLTRHPSNEYKKTVVFDLDETLVHCVEGKKGDTDILVKFPTGESLVIGINIRPYARECLAEASKDFEVIVFTASHKSYADAVLDYLDPRNEYIHHRLYREHCLMINGMHVKDLRVLGNRKISNIVIIDNTVHSFAFHIDNGIPIITWHNDRYDRELFKLIDYLKLLATSVDIRETNRQTFKLQTFYLDFISKEN